MQALAPLPAPAAAPAAALAPVGVPAPAAPVDEPLELSVVTSPIVGTFYRSPDPSSPSFVEVGQRVKKGQTLCIIEAMKLMNEIESEYEGEIVKVVRRERPARAVRRAALRGEDHLSRRCSRKSSSPTAERSRCA